jgi:hypothetical protein
VISHVQYSQVDSQIRLKKRDASGRCLGVSWIA